MIYSFQQFFLKFFFLFFLFIFSKFEFDSSETMKTRQRSSMAVRNSSPDTLMYHSNVISNKINNGNNSNTFSAVIVKSSAPFPSQIPLQNQKSISDIKNEFTLGRLDGLVSSPNRCSKVRVADSRKIAAILLETNIIELQRHLLTITVQNQVSVIIFNYQTINEK